MRVGWEEKKRGEERSGGKDGEREQERESIQGCSLNNHKHTATTLSHISTSAFDNLNCASESPPLLATLIINLKNV